MPMLEVENIHSYYGNIHALKGISLTVEKGEIVTLIGANGAGKSSTLRGISGLVPYRGTITYKNWNLRKHRPTKSWPWGLHRCRRAGGSSAI